MLCCASYYIIVFLSERHESLSSSSVGCNLYARTNKSADQSSYRFASFDKEHDVTFLLILPSLFVTAILIRRRRRHDAIFLTTGPDREGSMTLLARTSHMHRRTISKLINQGRDDKRDLLHRIQYNIFPISTAVSRGILSKRLIFLFLGSGKNCPFCFFALTSLAGIVYYTGSRKWTRRHEDLGSVGSGKKRIMRAYS